MTVYDCWAAFWAKATPIDSIWTTTLFPPRSTYNPARDMPDLTGKVALVTGGAAGIGKAAAKQLLLKNATVYIGARNPAKITRVIKTLEAETGKTAIALPLDLEDLPTVKRCAEDFLAREGQLDLLFCNAGVMASPVGELTKQGYDKQFGTNAMGHYLLESLLLPALRASHEATGTRARVVHTTSSGHAMAPDAGFVPASVKGGPERDALNAKWGKMGATWALYGQSKLANNLVANYFDRTHGSQIVNCSVHPGYIDSELHRDEAPWQRAIGALFHWPIETGAHTLLYAATSQEGDGLGGKYLIPFARMGKADKRADSVQLQDELKAWLDSELKAYL